MTTPSLRDAAQDVLNLWCMNATELKINSAMNALRSALAAEQAQEQTPVAWMHPTQPRNIVKLLGHMSAFEAEQKLVWIPLFAHPAPAQTPMREEEIVAAWNKAIVDSSLLGVTDVMLFARAVERHHGIGGKE
jgi:hypothetical protein